MLRATLFVPFLLSLTPLLGQAENEHRFAREGVLGTSGDLVLAAANVANAERAAEAVFAAVAKLEDTLSLWRDDSELAKLIAVGKGRASPEVSAILAVAEDWQTRSGGAIAPGVAKAAELWREAEKSGFAPAADSLRGAAANAASVPWRRAGDQVEFSGPLTLDAFAKGWIVDRAILAVADVPGVKLLSFQIGGDLRAGAESRHVAIVDPREPADNGKPLATVAVRDAAVASSGGYARPFEVGVRKHSHVIDPRTGQPCDDVLGASVVASDTATADALSTALCVLGPEQGLKLLASIPGAEGVLVTRDGKVHRSKGFAELCVAEEPAAEAAGAWPNGFDVEVTFDIKAPNQSGGGRRGGWKRPYVAVWVEDATGLPARTLCLWMENSRWLRDLRRWSRQHQNEPGFADAISQATRKAGHYTLRWDGKDDQGRVLAPGEYTIYIEAAREHGTYQIAKATLQLGNKKQTVKLDDNTELAGMTIDFGKHGK